MDKTFILPLFGGGGGSTKDATVTPEDLLEGVTAYGKDGKIEGTIPVKSEDDITVEERTTTIPAGYYPEEIETSVSEEYIIPEGTLTVTKSGESDVREYEKIDVPVAVAEFLHNGTYRAEDMGVLGYEQVEVNVTPNLQDKLITENGTYTAETGYDGFGTVLVNVAHGDFDYLCFTAVDAGSTIGMTHNGTNLTTTKPLIYISTDNKETWRVWDYSTITLADVGDKVYMYGTNIRISRSTTNYSQFTMTGKISATGNTQTLLSQDGSRPDISSYCYYRLFYNCSSLTTAPKLPTTELATYCYYEMFYGCSSLTAAPELPATVLASYCYYRLFYNCRSLTTAPELPAIKLFEYCYYEMFYNCRSLTTAPELPATTLASDCYYQMFFGCTSLTTAPELPATTLASECYAGMFRACTSLTTAPELPATTLANYCYSTMFGGCTSLTTAPELPATKLASYCYNYMFSGCTSLTTAPSVLPATTLAGVCYNYMFSGCTSLTTAPELPAIKLADSCYISMFQGCRNLNYIAVFASPWNTSYAYNWVQYISSTGTFIKDPNATIPVGTSGIPSGWTVYDLVDGVVDLENKTITLTTNLTDATIYYTTDGSEPTTDSEVYTGPISVPEGSKYYVVKTIAANDDITLPVNTISYSDYFYFEALQAGSTFKINQLYSGCTYEYSRDGNTWTNLGTTKITLTNIGDRAYIRQSSDKGYWQTTGYTSYIFVTTGNLKVGGCISTLAYKDASHDRPNMSYANSMVCIFYNCTAITDASELKMDFVELTTACYDSLFYGCKSLTTAPELPVTVLARNCYYEMFRGCTNLNSITVHATSWDTSAASNWVNGVSSTGTFTCPSSLSISTGVSGIPSGWTRVDL